MSERQHLSWRRAELLAEWMKESYAVAATVAVQIRDGGAHPVVGTLVMGECRFWTPLHNVDYYWFDGALDPSCPVVTPPLVTNGA